MLPELTEFVTATRMGIVRKVLLGLKICAGCIFSLLLNAFEWRLRFKIWNWVGTLSFHGTAVIFWDIVETGAWFDFITRKIVRPMLTESFPFNYMLKFSLSRHFEYGNEQITYHFWLCLFLRNSRQKSGIGKMNGTVITNQLQNSFKIKDNNVYESLYYWNFRTSSFKQVAVSYYWVIVW